MGFLVSTKIGDFGKGSGALSLKESMFSPTPSPSQMGIQRS
jgi:hypothetical protein